MKDNVFLPLDGFPFFHAREPDPARPLLMETLGPLEIDSIGGSRAFDWRVNRVALGPLTLFSGRMLGGWVIQGEPSSYMVVVSRTGHARLVQPHGEADVLPGRTGGIVSTATQANWRVDTGFSSVSLRIPPQLLEAQIEALTGVAAGKPLWFTPGLCSAAGSGASLERLLRFLIGELEQGSTALEHPMVAAGVSEVIVRSLLLGHRHSASHLLEKPAPSAGPRCVRLVEEYMQAHAARPVRMGEVAKLAGTTVRSIQAAFRAHRGYSPMAFLRKKRLELARRALQAPQPFTSVTSIAYACGFLHPGQFSIDYRKLFGESPSQTLHRSRSLMGYCAAGRPRLGASLIGP